jgi:hypothetical protein
MVGGGFGGKRFFADFSAKAKKLAGRRQYKEDPKLF